MIGCVCEDYWCDGVVLWLCSMPDFVAMAAFLVLFAFAAVVVFVYELVCVEFLVVVSLLSLSRIHLGNSNFSYVHTQYEI